MTRAQSFRSTCPQVRSHNKDTVKVLGELAPEIPLADSNSPGISAMLSSLGVQGGLSVDLVLSVLSRLSQSSDAIKMKVERVSWATISEGSDQVKQLTLLTDHNLLFLLFVQMTSIFTYLAEEVEFLRRENTVRAELLVDRIQTAFTMEPLVWLPDRVRTRYS